MIWRFDKKIQERFSTIRSIILVSAGVTAAGFYHSWWITDSRLTSPWLILGFIVAVAYVGIQIMGNWLLYLAAHWRYATPAIPIRNLTVDVFVTAYKEDHSLIERCLTAARDMRGQHKTWLLDDGKDPGLARMAERLGVGYLTREGNKDAKAGNLNAALAKTDGDIIVIFDIDHAPLPDFLEKTLSYFIYPKLGFVQVMLNFINDEDGWVAQAASESSLDFYNPTSIGSDGLSSTTLIGSNAVIRRKALESIGGYKPGLAEDLATSIALHAAGWHSLYVERPLAPGYAPPDLAAWFTQQLKWARGVFELLITDYPRYFFKLKTGQRVSYAVRMTYYWLGTVIGIHMLTTIGILFSGSEAILQTYQQYLIHLFPLMGLVLLIRTRALRRWSHRSPMKQNLQWKPMALVCATWPIYILAWIMAVFRVPLGFRATPKTSSGKVNPIWLMPQIITTILALVGVCYTILFFNGWAYPLVLGFAIALVAPQLLLFGQNLLLFVKSSAFNRVHSYHQAAD